MDHPLVLELNTRCWLRELSENAGRPITLATVPESEFSHWKHHSFTHIWLMGVWTTGPKTRASARAQPELQALAAKAFGECENECLGSSPYAIAKYAVAKSLGGPAALRNFREKLQGNGLALILDFVPNHIGLDHPWIENQTSFLVTNTSERPDTFPVTTSAGTIRIAHGRDPYCPAWNDTAQLDYRNANTRSAMIETLQSVAAQCDGVRCDMAMLLLNDVFEKTWQAFPTTSSRPTSEFWSDAIAAVKRTYPKFLFIAEAYWNLEPRLQSLGFDYCYDKVFYDKFVARDVEGLREHIQSTKSFQPVRFLENHDEPRIASILSFPEHQAALALLLEQPGMRLLHDGQLTGRKHRLPVQFECYWREKPDPEICELYGTYLNKLGKIE